MVQNARELFIVGLRNAHAMEIQARELMERQSERTNEYPEVKARLTEHLAETNAQLGRLEQILEGLGETTSTLKDTAQSVMANMMAMAHTVAGDEILNNTFSNNAFENFEIAAYRSLLAMCGAAQVEGARPLLEKSLEEEEKMAAWVASNVEAITQQFMSKEGVAARAA
jgi:ferritin-like metal-binding protein YciE